MEEKFMQVMDKLDILLHPIESLKETGYELLILIEKFSFNVCLVAGFVALLLYVFGYDKGKKWAFMIPCIYLILSIIVGVITNA